RAQAPRPAEHPRPAPGGAGRLRISSNVTIGDNRDAQGWHAPSDAGAAGRQGAAHAMGGGEGPAPLTLPQRDRPARSGRKTGKGPARSGRKTGKGPARSGRKTGKGPGRSGRKTGKGPARSGRKTGKGPATVVAAVGRPEGRRRGRRC